MPVALSQIGKTELQLYSLVTSLGGGHCLNWSMQKTRATVIKESEFIMARSLDNVHHIALQVNDIDRSVEWYRSKFSCEVAYQDKSWALLNFGNISLALVLPSQHPPHFAVTSENASIYGDPVLHRDGTRSVYIEDPSGNHVEMLELTHL
jgi:catechol-2,3-dioxygenase